MISHRSACYLHGLTDELPTPVEVSVPHGARRYRIDGVVVHQSLALDSTTIHDLPVTSLASTVVNVASSIRDLYDSRGLVYRATLEHSLAISDLMHRALLAQKNGKAPVVRAARELAAGAWSVPEGVLWTAHVEVGLPTPELNGAVDTVNGTRYVDLLHRQARLGIEVDGQVWHSGPADRERDRLRQLDLEEVGLRVIRFSAAEVLYDTPRVLLAVMQSLDVYMPTGAWQRRWAASLRRNG